MNIADQIESMNAQSPPKQPPAEPEKTTAPAEDEQPLTFRGKAEAVETEAPLLPPKAKGATLNPNQVVEPVDGHSYKKDQKYYDDLEINMDDLDLME